jgi:hypothetical protein
MPSDLAILSAEQYGGAAFTTNAGQAKESPLVNTNYGPRKRARKSSVTLETEAPEDGEEEKRKRARGRPRLDTKDQTAAEVGCLCFVSSDGALMCTACPNVQPSVAPICYLFVTVPMHAALLVYRLLIPMLRLIGGDASRCYISNLS